MIKLLDDGLYEVISSWWKAYDWPPLPRQALPKRGYVSHIGEKPIIAGFLFETDSAISLFEWVVANPETTFDERTLGFNGLVEKVICEAKGFGSKALFASLSNESLIKRYLAAGFVASDKKTTTVIYSIV